MSPALVSRRTDILGAVERQSQRRRARVVTRWWSACGEASRSPQMIVAGCCTDGVALLEVACRDRQRELATVPGLGCHSPQGAHLQRPFQTWSRSSHGLRSRSNNSKRITQTKSQNRQFLLNLNLPLSDVLSEPQPWACLPAPTPFSKKANQRMSHKTRFPIRCLDSDRKPNSIPNASNKEIMITRSVK